jgi:hypothetical protein
VYKNKIKKYLKFFTEKNINSISLMFSPNICLRDWNVNLKGLKNVIIEYKNIFDKAKVIKIKILKIYQDKKTVIVELLISINNCEAKYVIDLIEFDKKNKIKYIKAYLGS